MNVNHLTTEHDQTSALRKEALEEMRKAALLMRKLGEVAAADTAGSIETHRLRETAEALTAQQLEEKLQAEQQEVTKALVEFAGALPRAEVHDLEPVVGSPHALHRPAELRAHDLQEVRLFEASVWWDRTSDTRKGVEGGYENVITHYAATPYYQIGERFIGERKWRKGPEIDMLLMSAVEVGNPKLMVVRTSLTKKDYVEKLTLEELSKPLLDQNAYGTTDQEDGYSLRTQGDYWTKTNGNNRIATNRAFEADIRRNYKPGYEGVPLIDIYKVPEARLTRQLLHDYNVEFYATRLATLFGAEEEYQRSLGAIDDPRVETL